MKIVKEFESSEFASKIQHVTFRHFNYLKWGLGDDANLYCQGKYSNSEYSPWINPFENSVYPDINEMKKIVKEFGHLLVFT